MEPIIFVTLHLGDLIQLKTQYQLWGIINKNISTCLFDVLRFFHAYLFFFSNVYTCFIFVYTYVLFVFLCFLFVFYILNVYTFWWFHVILVFTRLWCSHVCLIFTHLWCLLVLLTFTPISDVYVSIRYFHLFLIFQLSFGNCLQKTV